MGAWSADSQHQRRDHGRRTTSAPTRSRWSIDGRRHPAHRARRRRRHRHRAEGVGAGAGRRGRRRAPAWTSPRCASFLAEQIARAKADDVLFSVHLKATMMKVSDPIIFGHVVQGVLPRRLRSSTAPRCEAAGSRPNDGLGAPPGRPRRAARRRRRSRPPSSQGWPTGPGWRWSTPTRASPTCTCPSDVIVDASMPAMIRTSGHMWGPDGEEADTLAVIPDSSYAGDLPGRHRRLPRPRRLRPGHDGLGAQRRPDGPGGRGVRLARQDLRDRRGRHGPGGRRRGRRR